jgi:hypothetical protein
MAATPATQTTELERITQMLITMPREEIELLFLDFARGFADALRPAKPPEDEERVRARVATMTAREMATLLAPLVRIGEEMSEQRRARGNHGTRTWNPARF